MLEQYLEQERSGFFGVGQSQQSAGHRWRRSPVAEAHMFEDDIPSLLDILVEKPSEARLRASDFYRQLVEAHSDDETQDYDNYPEVSKSLSQLIGFFL